MGVRLVVSLEIEQKDEVRVALLETNRPAQRPPELEIVRKNVKLVASLEIEQKNEVRVALLETSRPRRPERKIVRKNVKLVASLGIEAVFRRMDAVESCWLTIRPP